MIILKIGPLLYGVTTTTHLGHPFPEVKTGLTREDIVGYMTVSTGGRIFLSRYKGFRVRPFKITLVFLRMTLLTSLVIEKKCGYPSEEFWIRMFYPFFLDV
jgi:hypothetical protein